MAFIVPGLLCSIGLLLIVFRGWLWLRSPAKRLCPGPILNWRQRVWPLWLVYRPRCGYDLSGHALRVGSTITCPECGRAVARRKEMIRTARAMRPAHLGGVFILTGLLVYQYPPLAATQVVQYTPTEVLLRGEGMLGVGTPLEVRDEIRRRAMDHELREDQVCRFVQLLINDLHDDSLANNAKSAIEQLAIFGVFCTESLMASLKSEDSQQRALAAEVLRGLPDPCVDQAELIRVSVDDLRGSQWPGTRSDARQYLSRHIEQAKPLLIETLNSEDEAQRRAAASLLRQTQTEGETFHEMLRISMTDLRDDDYRGNRGSASWYLYEHREIALPLLIEAMESDDEQQRRAAISILRETSVGGEPLDRLLRMSVNELQSDDGSWRERREFAYLLRHAEVAEPLLLEGMASHDPQQRMLCAAIAGCGGRLHVMEMATPILLGHLADNKIGGDAIVAARAIFGFGLPVLPLLEPFRRSADEQQRQTVEYIVRRLTTTESLVSLQHELPLARLTIADVDALVLEADALDMPDF